MKSGLEGRNNVHRDLPPHGRRICLNEVRPGRPEQFADGALKDTPDHFVSMKSGLEGRNNRDWTLSYKK